jgi:predicted aldo/keto reductase-like oxidoreductase
VQYRQIPKTGDSLSALGYGTMRLPLRRGRIDEERATRQIRWAIDNGVNYIDTAFPYHRGESEGFLGRALLGGYRQKVRLATKLPSRVKTRKDMDRILDLQLHRLQTDHIDYYLLHELVAPSWKRLCDLGVLEFLDSALASGKIRNAGFSFHGDRHAFREIIDAYDWVFCMIQYNFLDDRNQAGIEGLRYAASKKIAVMVMEPLRGGTLAQNLPPEVRLIYNRTGRRWSAAEWALRWVWNHPEVTVVLSGMNDENHIAENIRTCENALPGSMTVPELNAIRAVAETYRKRMPIGCTGCAYCLPCPFGVDIPYCFSLYNDYHLGGIRERVIARGEYGYWLMEGRGEIPADASLCHHCGRCESKCPQQIPIQEELRKVDLRLGGLRTKLMIPVIRRLFPSTLED